MGGDDAAPPAPAGATNNDVSRRGLEENQRESSTTDSTQSSSTKCGVFKEIIITRESNNRSNVNVEEHLRNCDYVLQQYFKMNLQFEGHEISKVYFYRICQ